MTQREKMLAGLVGVLVALWGFTVGLDRYRTALEQNRAEQRDADSQLSEARLAAARGRFARRKLGKWKKQSLPTDHDVALSAYQDWLHEQLTAAGLKIKELNHRDSRRGGTQYYHQLSFVVQAEGKLNQLTDFLYRFYQSPHLHRISKAALIATNGAKALNISLTVDALSLAGCERGEKLAEGGSDAISKTLDELQHAIVGRNLFVAHGRAKPADATQVAAASEKHSERDDEARVTGMSLGEAGWQMSVLLGKSGKVLVFREGDAIEIGRFTGTVDQLDGRRAILSIESTRLQVYLGEPLSEARPIRDRSG